MNKMQMRNKIAEIKGFIYKKVFELDDWETFEVNDNEFGKPGAYYNTQATHISIGGIWTAREDVTRCFRRKIIIPDGPKDEKIILDIDTGGEGLAYLNGKIQSGVTTSINTRPFWDMSRHRVVIPSEFKRGSSIEVIIATGLNYFDRLITLDAERGIPYIDKTKIGIPTENYTFKKALLAEVDVDAERYYFAVETVYRALGVIMKQERIFQGVYNALQSSLLAVNMEDDRECFIRSVVDAEKLLFEKLNEIPYAKSGKVLMAGHSHLDVAWLWPLSETLKKCGRTFANTLALMDEYPELIFTQSQPQLYEYAKTYYPELYSRIKERVKEGRWEPAGNMWVECDANITSGESMIRQILYGSKFFKDEFGVTSKILWMPDVFGYSWALPQIIKRSGMEFFMTAKLMSNDTNKFPYTLFQWQGIDGTRILAYLQHVPYLGDFGPSYINNAMEGSRQKDIFNEALGSFGYGDGGGGVTYQMLECSKVLKYIPGLPETEISDANRFFVDASEKMDKFPVWNGELYFENHRGTYTTQARTKLNNRSSELLYRQAEITSSIAMMFGGEYPQKLLLKGWKKILLNQFHDILPGSSINRVYRDCENDYSEIRSIGMEAMECAMQLIMRKIKRVGDGKNIIIYNPLSWTRTGMLQIDTEDDIHNMALYNEYDECIPFSIVKKDGAINSILFEAKDIPSIGYSIYRLGKGEKTDAADLSIKVTKEFMENKFFSININSSGNISKIYDKRYERDVLCSDGEGNILQIFEDKPEGYDAWDIDKNYHEKMWNVDKVESIEVIESGSLRGVLRITKTFNKSRIIQDICIYNSIPKIDFKTEVDWFETDKMLKAAFITNMLSQKATYEIAYGSIERPTHRNTSWDQAQFEVSAHKWMDLSEGGYGLSMINDCKYGCDIRDNIMRLTLLRSPVFPDIAADKGHHEFTYSLYPHEGDWREGGTVRAGYELNVPLAAAVKCENEYSEDANLPGSMSFFSIDRKNVIIDTIKKAEDDDSIIIRVYESEGKRGKVRIDTAFRLNNVIECNLMEIDEDPVCCEENGFDFSIRPFEIKTFRVNSGI